MVKANSLLYAVYICLIVAILCGAMLFLASLYDRLNFFYNTREQLYIQNQSAVNYALGNTSDTENIEYTNEDSGISYSASSKQYGLLRVLVTKAFTSADTVTSAHLIGEYDKDRNCLYLSNFSRGLSYNGNVTLIGNKKIPTSTIKPVFISGIKSTLVSEGKMETSDRLLPAINPDFSKFFNAVSAKPTRLDEIERSNDSVYFNSFEKETLLIKTGKVLQHISIKGNFIISANDTLIVKKDAILENVILKSKTIIIEEGFTGSLQALATSEILTGKQITLNYPSVLCVYSDKPGKITIGDENTLFGAAVIFGNSVIDYDQNSISTGEKTFIAGDIYCSGKLMLRGKVYGSVYTNEFFYKTPTKTYTNCLIDAIIDNTKRPDYYVTIPLFKSKNPAYGIFRKVL